MEKHGQYEACNFQGNNSSKSQWIFTKVYMCINIVESCLVIAHGQISSIFDSYLPVFYILANYKEMKFKSLYLGHTRFVVNNGQEIW